MTSVDKVYASSLCLNGMKHFEIMAYIANQASGYENVTFTRRDLYNHFDRDTKLDLLMEMVLQLLVICALNV